MAVESNIGDVVVKTTVNRGLSPEELAERAVEQIVSVSSSVDPVVRQQAEAFKNRIYHVALGIIKQAIKSDRTTLSNEFIQQGHPELVDILRRLYWRSQQQWRQVLSQSYFREFIISTTVLAAGQLLQRVRAIRLRLLCILAVQRCPLQLQPTQPLMRFLLQALIIRLAVIR